MQQLLVLAVLLGAAVLLQGCENDGIIGDIQHAFQLWGSSSSHGSGSDGGDQQPQLPSEGVEIPLAVKSWGNGLRLAISVRPSSGEGGEGEALPAQELVLDSGSSTLAFCDTALASSLSPLRLPSYISCNRYNPGGTPTGYWGNFYKGSLELGDDLQLNESYYSVMQQQRSMPCTSGFRGIFGIAFKQLDAAFAADDPSFRPFDLSGGSIQCPKQAKVDLVPPLARLLRSGSGSGQLGIHWSGRRGSSEGALYLGKAATSNPHYTKGTLAGQAALGEFGWYDVTIQQMSLTSTNVAWTNFQCNPRAGSKGTCIMDTGTPILSVPPQIYKGISDLYYQSQLPGRGLGSLTVTLAGKQGSPVTLEFSLRRLLENGWVKPGGNGVILGLPLWAFYYTVFDIKAGSAAFVAKPHEEQTSPEMEPQWSPPWFLTGEGLEVFENATRDLDAQLAPENATGRVQTALPLENSTVVAANTSNLQGGSRRLEDFEPVHV